MSFPQVEFPDRRKHDLYLDLIIARSDRSKMCYIKESFDGEIRPQSDEVLVLFPGLDLGSAQYGQVSITSRWVNHAPDEGRIWRGVGMRRLVTIEAWNADSFNRLREMNLAFTVVYPRKGFKDTWVAEATRKKGPEWAERIEVHWDSLHRVFSEQTNCIHHVTRRADVHFDSLMFENIYRVAPTAPKTI